MCRTACRSPTNWRGASSAWRRSPGHARPLRRGRRNGRPASRPNTMPRWQHGRPRRGPTAKSQAAGSLLVVANDVVQATNDKQQPQPMLDKLGASPAELGEAETLLADTGYCSEVNVEACVAAEVDPLIAMGRQPHYPPLAERFAPPPPPPENPTPVEAMAHRLKTPEGKKLYALRKQTPEPVFGIIKSVLGFRQFLLRGLDNVRGEWNLVTMAFNMKRLFALAGAG